MPEPHCPGYIAGGTDDSGITSVNYPAERAIFQRAANNTSTVAVTLTVAAGITCVEITTALAAADPTAAGTALPWQMLGNIKLTPNPDGTSVLHGTLVQPAGGWYSLNFAAWTAQPPATPPTNRALHSLQRFGIGEIFLVAGQSNSTNLGSVDMMMYQPDDHVAAGYNPTGTGSSTGDASTPPTWVLGTAPMPGPNDGGARGTPWGWAGSLLVQDLKVPVGFVLIG